MNSDKILEYHTTASDCGCPAFLYRPGPCKHIKAVRAAIVLVKSAGYRLTPTKGET